MTQFQLSKTGSLVAAPAGMPPPGPYYSSIVDMRDVELFPFEYALYFSTDHHHLDGGIWLYVCSGSPTESANWISYDAARQAGAFAHLSDAPAANPIFRDSVQGDGHTETPHANVIDGTVYLSYHKNGIPPSQATLLATSRDGVTFARLNGAADSVILRYDPKETVGDGHTGYFRWSVNRFSGISANYVGYSLYGGGDNYHSAIWSSDDAKQWRCLDILTPLEGLALDHENLMIIWHELDPSSIRRLANGEYVAICGVGNRASGSAARISELYEIYLADDGRTLTRVSQRLLGVGGAATGAGDSEELSASCTLTIDGREHLIYVGAASGGRVNTVMGAVGDLSTSTPTAPLLPAGDRRRHIWRRG